MLSVLLLGGFCRVHVSQLSFVSSKGATTPCGFLAPSFSWTQSPWSLGPSPQGRCGLARHALGRGGGGPKQGRLRPEGEMARNSRRGVTKIDVQVLLCKNRVKGICPGCPRPGRPQGWTPAGVGSARRGHGVCLLLTGLMESGPWGSALWGYPLSWWGDAWTSRCSGAVGQRELAPRAVCPCLGPGLGRQGEAVWVHLAAGREWVGCCPGQGMCVGMAGGCPGECWRGQRKG